LPLALRLRFAKREVIVRRLARQMRSGYVPDPRCGRERSQIKKEPTWGCFVWWLLTVWPYDVYCDDSPKKVASKRDETELKNQHDSQETHGKTQLFESPLGSDSKTVTTEYTRVHLPGQTDSIVIEVPPVIVHCASVFCGERSPRPFESLTLLFWLAITVFGLILALAIVGIYAITL
jgi:hypothetical protein